LEVLHASILNIDAVPIRNEYHAIVFYLNRVTIEFPVKLVCHSGYGTLLRH
jgi:hypothetical protein